MFTKERLNNYEILLKESWSKSDGRLVKELYQPSSSDTEFNLSFGYYNLYITKDQYDPQNIQIAFDSNNLFYPFYLKPQNIKGNTIVMNWLDYKQDFNLAVKLYNKSTGEVCMVNTDNEFCPTAMFVRDRKVNEAGYEYVFSMPDKNWKVMAYAYKNEETPITAIINEVDLLENRNRNLTALSANRLSKLAAINKRLSNQSKKQENSENDRNVKVWFPKGQNNFAENEKAKKAVLQKRKEWA